jgi:hypothetical protein
MDKLFDTYIKTYAKNRAVEVSESPRVNFVSIDAAIDAFEHGKKIGVEEFKRKIKEEAIARFNKQIESTLQIVNQLLSVFKNKPFELNKLFLAINTDSSKILLTLPSKQHNSDKFMNLFYPLTSDLEDTYSKKGFQLNIFAVDESDQLNLELLKCDGYNFCYNIKENKKVF